MLLERDFRFIQDLVRDRTSIVLDEGKEYLAICRLDSIVRSEGLQSLGHLVELLRQGGSTSSDQRLEQRVVDALTTNETSWFRDLHPFESLRTHVLPDLIERKQRSRSLTIWSAACASGQESYSLAMAIREYFPQLAGWQLTILATDISTAMLERTRAGRYGAIEINRGLPAHMLVEYFHRDGVEWAIDDSIRSMVTVQHCNLAGAWPPMPPMDLVLMRNVMIYFDVETKSQVLRRAREVLAPHGYLLLGAAETTLNLDDGFERSPVGMTGWYRLKGSGPATGGQG
jgi:chemotaxis protein methyltransferase CheR